MDLLKNKEAFRGFCKNHRRHYRSQLAFSVTLPKWLKDPDNLGMAKQVLALKKYPGEVNDIVNIIRTLERSYSVEKHQLLEQAILIHKHKKKTIHKYLSPYFQGRAKLYKLEKVLKEQVTRGFTNEFEINPNLPYIRSNVNYHYIYPYQPKPNGYNMCGIYGLLPRIGIPGFNGIVLPKNLLNKELRYEHSNQED